MINHVKNEIKKKEKIIKCYTDFFEIAAVKYDEEQQRNDELMTTLSAIADEKSKIKNKGKLRKEDIRYEKETIRYEEETRELVADSLAIMECYSDILKDLEKSLNRKLCK